MEPLPDQKSSGDVAHELGRAVVSAVPAVGGPLQVLFENVFTAPLDRRREAWFMELGSAIEDVLVRLDGLEAKSLGENPGFVTTAIQATQIALRNHQQVKLDALRNAVLNSGLPNPPSDDEQAVFLRLVDELTAWHLRILVFLGDPRRWIEDNSLEVDSSSVSGLAALLELCFPDLAGRRDLYDQMVADLMGAGLLPQGAYLHASMTVSGIFASRTAPLGQRFLAFITAPEPLASNK